MLPAPFDDDDVKYIRLSMPVSCCSMTWMTVRSTVSALAPGIHGADRHLRRRDVRIGLGRQRADGEHAAQRDEDRDDPGEYRAVDEKLRHC